MEDDRRRNAGQETGAAGEVRDTVYVSSQQKPGRQRALHSQACQSCRAKKVEMGFPSVSSTSHSFSLDQVRYENASLQFVFGASAGMCIREGQSPT